MNNVINFIKKKIKSDVISSENLIHLNSILNKLTKIIEYNRINSIYRDMNLDGYYLYEFARSLYNTINIKDIRNFNLLRIGRKYDGGYVMIDDFKNVDCAYSFGINDDVSWDLDICNRNINCFMYDHTINEIPIKNALFNFHKIGICPREREGENLKSLSHLIDINNHANCKKMILKIDVEGAERLALVSEGSSVLDKFSQIIIEIHDLHNALYMNENINLLQHLSKTHTPVHIHGNNFGEFVQLNNYILPEVLEITYANNAIYSFSNSRKFFPTALDLPNCKDRMDIIIGIWNK